MKDDGCCHDYDEGWVCKICGYQLPNMIQDKIKQVGKETKAEKSDEPES